MPHDAVACRPHDLDEAMHRRITMTFEFRRPDHTQRQQIWRRQLPDKIKRSSDVDINLLALKYELSGGYIRNAVQAALSRLVFVSAPILVASLGCLLPCIANTSCLLCLSLPSRFICQCYSSSLQLAYKLCQLPSKPCELAVHLLAPLHPLNPCIPAVLGISCLLNMLSRQFEQRH